MKKDTRYKKVSTLKEGDYVQVGQWTKTPNQPKLSRLYSKEGNTKIHLHGDNVAKRFLKCFDAERKGVILPQEPQQYRKMVKNIPSPKLEAMVGIASAELENRL